MNTRPAKDHRKLSTKGKATGQKKSNYGQLAAVIVVCTTAWLLCIYLLPSPDDGLQPADTTQSQHNRGAVDVNSVANLPAHGTGLKLPTESLYVGSSEEKKRLLHDVENAVEAYPNDPSILQIAGLTYSEIQQSERAIELLKKSLEIDPNNPQVVDELADLLMQVGKHDEAAIVLDRAIGRGLESESLLSALGEAYIHTSQLEAAVKVLERAIALAVADPTLHLESKAPLRLAQTLTQLGLFEEAERQARTAVANQPNEVANYIALSNALMRQNKREEALKVRSEMPSRDPVVPATDEIYESSFRGFASHTYTMLGSAYAAHNSMPMAEKMFLKTLELEPDSPKSALLLADVLRQQSKTPDAISVYKRLLEIAPNDLINYYNLASLAVSVKDLKLAEDSLRLATKVDSTGNSDLRLAAFLLGVGNKDSVSYARTAVNRLSNIDAYLVLIDASRAFGDTASAYNAYLKAKSIAPNDPRLANFNP